MSAKIRQETILPGYTVTRQDTFEQIIRALNSILNKTLLVYWRDEKVKYVCLATKNKAYNIKIVCTRNKLSTNPFNILYIGKSTLFFGLSTTNCQRK